MNSTAFLAKLEKGFVYCAAPLEEVSDSAFRTVCYNHGADMTFTEMTNIEGLSRKNASAWSRLKFNDETPAIIQVLPNKEESIEKFLKLFEPKKGFMGFNYNFGCPSPNVIKLGLGCAMVKRVSKINSFIKIMRDHGYPVSLKMRLGLNNFEKSNKVYLNLINNSNPDFFIVHARHGMQKYSNPADFSVYEEIVKTGKLIIANGDINTKERVEKLKEQGVKGVMIGRKAVSDPSIFNQLKGINDVSMEKIKEEYLELAKKYANQEKYPRNVLQRLGSDMSADRNRLI